NSTAAAARPIRSAEAPSALRLAGPNLSASSQNTTSVPRGVVENGTKPTLTASDIGNSSKIRALRRAWSALADHSSRDSQPEAACSVTLWPDRRCAAKRRRVRPATLEELLTLSARRHPPAILLTDQRDGSETINPWDKCWRDRWGPLFRGRLQLAVPSVAGRGSCDNDGVDRQVYLPHDARVVCAGPGQPHGGDLDYAGVARHRPDDQPGPDSRDLPRSHQPRHPRARS